MPFNTKSAKKHIRSAQAAKNRAAKYKETAEAHRETAKSHNQKVTSDPSQAETHTANANASTASADTADANAEDQLKEAEHHYLSALDKKNCPLDAVHELAGLYRKINSEESKTKMFRLYERFMDTDLASRIWVAYYYGYGDIVKNVNSIDTSIKLFLDILNDPKTTEAEYSSAVKKLDAVVSYLDDAYVDGLIIAFEKCALAGNEYAFYYLALLCAKASITAKQTLDKTENTPKNAETYAKIQKDLQVLVWETHLYYLEAVDFKKQALPGKPLKKLAPTIIDLQELDPEGHWTNAQNAKRYQQLRWCTIKQRKRADKGSAFNQLAIECWNRSQITVTAAEKTKWLKEATANYYRASEYEQNTSKRKRRTSTTHPATRQLNAVTEFRELIPEILEHGYTSLAGKRIVKPMPGKASAKYVEQLQRNTNGSLLDSHDLTTLARKFIEGDGVTTNLDRSKLFLLQTIDQNDGQVSSLLDRQARPTRLVAGSQDCIDIDAAITAAVEHIDGDNNYYMALIDLGRHARGALSYASIYFTAAKFGFLRIQKALKDSEKTTGSLPPKLKSEYFLKTLLVYLHRALEEAPMFIESAYFHFLAAYITQFTGAFDNLAARKTRYFYEKAEQLSVYSKSEAAISRLLKHNMERPTVPAATSVKLPEEYPSEHAARHVSLELAATLPAIPPSADIANAILFDRDQLVLPATKPQRSILPLLHAASGINPISQFRDQLATLFDTATLKAERPNLFNKVEREDTAEQIQAELLYHAYAFPNEQPMYKYAFAIATSSLMQRQLVFYKQYGLKPTIVSASNISDPPRNEPLFFYRNMNGTFLTMTRVADAPGTTHAILAATVAQMNAPDAPPDEEEPFPAFRF